MGYPAATGRGTSRTNATRTRDLALTAFWRRNSFGIWQRRMAVGSSSRSTGMGRLFFSARRALGETSGRGESPAQTRGVVCADRLAKKPSARASGVSTDALNLQPITHESTLRQSADWKMPAVGLSRPQISN
jgi:hypothetical protein